ncbi:MAG: trypsin-like peptidase domain-containing protein [Pseudomonadota bacterium]
MAHKANYVIEKTAPGTRLNQLMSWMDEHGDSLLGDPANGLEAIGIGKKNCSSINNNDDDWCITGFVKKKLSKKEMSLENVNMFSQTASASAVDYAELSNIELDVVETGSSFSSLPGLRIPVSQRGQFGGPPPAIDLQKRFDSVRSGIGITNPVGSYPNSLSVGTLGFVVEDEDEIRYLVSNNHVIARENSAQIGNAVVQPGTLDLTQTELQLMSNLNRLRSRLQIGNLSGWVDIKFGGVTNEVDVAIAELNNSRNLDTVARIGFGSTARGIASPYQIDDDGNVAESTSVYKAGRTTGWTEGHIAAIAVNSNVRYTKGIANFKNQLAIVATSDNGGTFSDAGDSGSAIWNERNQLVGLLFAGSSAQTLANPIDLVMQEITAELGNGQLTLVTE